MYKAKLKYFTDQEKSKTHESECFIIGTTAIGGEIKIVFTTVNGFVYSKSIRDIITCKIIEN